MNEQPSIKNYLKKAVLQQAFVGLAAMLAISVAVTFFLARYKMDSDLKRSAIAAAESFRSRILEGDIKATENQIHNVLGLQAEEKAFVLNSNLERIYKSPSGQNAKISICRPVGETCFESYFGPGQIFLPIYFDEKRESLFGYLYLSKSVQFDWIYVVIVFAIFALGYMALIFGLASVTNASLSKLSVDLEKWALRLKHNPKDKNPLSITPFAELSPLKEAIEGLNYQIEKFESRASEKAKTLLLRGIAHDILSPVAQVQLYLATLEKLADNPFAAGRIKETLIDMKSSLSKVSAIAAQVKTLNQSAEPVDPIDLKEVVMNEIESLKLRNELISKNIHLKFKADDKPIYAIISRIEISRILQNLIQNATDASMENAEINIELEQLQNNALLSVRDIGVGIQWKFQSKVFEPDFTSKTETGTGLGLFVVKHICEQRQSLIHLKSQPGQGTTISIQFPNIEGELHEI